MSLLGNQDQESSSSLFTEINVTPMVDVMLVLLIIFMVTAPFMIDTIGVNLPKGSGARAQGLTAPLTLSIDKSGQIFVADEKMNLTELREFLQKSLRVKNGEPIYIEADEEVRHGLLVSVMSNAHEAGAHKINIMMETK